MKYDAGENTWEAVGTPGFSVGQADYVSLFIDQGIPYVTYKDVANSEKATVMKYNGSNWVNVGSAGFSAGSADYTSLFIYNGIPYVVYQDGANSYKTTVMKFAP